MKYNRSRAKKNARIQKKIDARMALSKQFEKYNPRPRSEKTIQHPLEPKKALVFKCTN